MADTGTVASNGAVADLKATMNAVIPKVINRSHTALTVNNDLRDPAFLDSLSRSIETIQTYLASAPPDLRALAGNKANLLTQVRPTGVLDDATIQALAMLKSASDSDTAGSFSKPVKLTVANLNDIVAKFQALPAADRAAANTESARLFAARTPNRDPNTKVTVAKGVVSIAEDYLNVPLTGSSDVRETTGRALKDYLKQARINNPSINVDFTPQSVDQRTVRFMNELVQKQMKAAGVRPEELNALLQRLWNLERQGKEPESPQLKELGRTVALSDLVSYIASGALPNGETTVKPRTDSPWENNVQDRFFNYQVYDELLNTGRVTNKALFRPENANPQQQALIATTAQRLGIDMNAKTFTRDQVAAIATEIMVHQAKQLCIEERDITKAMTEGRFNPHLDDLLLAEEGLGKPPRDPRRVEMLERINITVEEQSDIYFHAQFTEYRAGIWNKRFGGLDAQHQFDLAKRLYPNMIPQNPDVRYEDVKDSPQVRDAMDKIKSYTNSPLSYFRWNGGDNDPYNLRAQYQSLRNNHYLPALREKANENGLNLCAPGGSSSGTSTGPGVRPGSPSGNGSSGNGVCYADDASGPCDPAKSAKPAKTATSCFADDVDGPCATPKRATTSACYADDFANASGCSSDTASVIRSNSRDTTGQTTGDTPCYADDASGPNCAVAAKPR